MVVRVVLLLRFGKAATYRRRSVTSGFAESRFSFHQTAMSAYALLRLGRSPVAVRPLTFLQNIRRGSSQRVSSASCKFLFIGASFQADLSRCSKFCRLNARGDHRWHSRSISFVFSYRVIICEERVCSDGAGGWCINSWRTGDSPGEEGARDFGGR